ncbi:hypothetical protein DSO57_1036236 [Entomophthora muscae]|uniref:Uncharacterized protein n=2 Tax=Entomophthora muscae TaxID=34485 RepID=A0ACC2U8Y0_9FUNG|nr:hypothetical protein DSO57_1031012 [Entomophthora muscae]KAJ9083278.1 hypothetical protein DSO57_1036236 [Entomophthora muscae]
MKLINLSCLLFALVAASPLDIGKQLTTTSPKKVSPPVLSKLDPTSKAELEKNLQAKLNHSNQLDNIPMKKSETQEGIKDTATAVAKDKTDVDGTNMPVALP